MQNKTRIHHNILKQALIRSISIGCIVLVISSFLTACSKEGAYILGPQMVQDVEVLVEVRPGAPKVGMNEFIIVATHTNHIPAKEFIVSLKIEGMKEWRQSIQDGHSGVYRRAVRINNPQTDVLLVQLDSKTQKTVLKFPLIPK